jgi:hypothetical protein
MRFARTVLSVVVGDPRGDANKKGPQNRGPLMFSGSLDQTAGAFLVRIAPNNSLMVAV